MEAATQVKEEKAAAVRAVKEGQIEAALLKAANDLEATRDRLKASQKTAHDTQKMLDAERNVNEETTQRLEAEMKAAKDELASQKQLAAVEVKRAALVKALSWWSVSSTPFPSFNSVLQVQILGIDEKSSNPGIHCVLSIVDEEGKVVGRSGRTPKSNINAPLYILLGDKGENAQKYIFFDVKWTKNKGNNTYKMKTEFYTFQKLVSGMKSGETTDNEEQLQLYKKPADFTRDPKYIRKLGKNSLMKVRWTTIKPNK
jgi:hypothetical protein